MYLIIVLNKVVMRYFIKWYIKWQQLVHS